MTRRVATYPLVAAAAVAAAATGQLAGLGATGRYALAAGVLLATVAVALVWSERLAPTPSIRALSAGPSRRAVTVLSPSNRPGRWAVLVYPLALLALIASTGTLTQALRGKLAWQFEVPPVSLGIAMGMVAVVFALAIMVEQRRATSGARMRHIVDMEARDAHRRASFVAAVDVDVAGPAQPARSSGKLADDRAESAYRRSDERGDAVGAYLLGVLIEQRGDLVGAEAAYRRADERGDAAGARRLGLVLQERGDLDGAEAAYRRAHERGDAVGTSLLGDLLILREDSDLASTRAGRSAKP